PRQKPAGSASCRNCAPARRGRSRSPGNRTGRLESLSAFRVRLANSSFQPRGIIWSLPRGLSKPRRTRKGAANEPAYAPRRSATSAAGIPAALRYPGVGLPALLAPYRRAIAPGFDARGSAARPDAEDDPGRARAPRRRRRRTSWLRTRRSYLLAPSFIAAKWCRQWCPGHNRAGVNDMTVQEYPIKTSARTGTVIVTDALDHVRLTLKCDKYGILGDEAELERELRRVWDQCGRDADAQFGCEARPSCVEAPDGRVKSSSPGRVGAGC